MLKIALPPRIPLALTPTPLAPIRRELLAALLGTNASAESCPDLWIKRDDMTGFLLGGNKIRKLEFTLAQAKSQGATHVITCGGIQSNHCRATAIACRHLNLTPVLILRMDDPTADPGVAGNVLLDRIVGAHIVRVSRGEYATRAEIFSRLDHELRNEGHVPFRVPEGASDGIGAIGYVEAVREIRDQLAALGGSVIGGKWAGNAPAFDSLVVAVGSGGTAAGLHLGLSAYPGVGGRVRAICVCDSTEFFAKKCAEIERECLAFVHADVSALPVSAPPLEFDERHIGPGYAQPYPEMWRDLLALAQNTGIVLDPVYSGKAWHGLLQTLRADPAALGHRIAFFATGGVFGLFPQADSLLPHLPAIT